MRHYFFEIGDQNTDRVLRVRADATPRRSQAGRDPADVPAPSSTTSRSTSPTRTRCDDAGRSAPRFGVEVTEVVDHGFMRSIYFTDPTASRSRPAGGSSTRPAAPPTYDGSAGLFADPDPVPALRELAATGELAWTPTTSLVDAGADPA